MEFNEQQQEILINFNKVKEQVTTGLKSNSSILVESKPGLGKNALVQEAVEHAGLRSLTIELSAHDEDFTSTLSAEGRRAKWEKRILNLINDEQSTALVVDASARHDISGFVEIAKQLNIPLIVMLTNDSDLKTAIFDDVSKLVESFDRDSHSFLVKGVALQRINEMKDSATEPTVAKKLTM